MSAKVYSVFMAVILLSVQAVQANENEEARATCERVEAVRIQEQGKKVAQKSLCALSARSLQYWSCVEGKIGEGYNWFSSSSQCDDIK